MNDTHAMRRTFTVLLAAACVACSADPTVHRVERADSAGIAIVQNIGPDRPLEWAHEEVLRLGAKDDGPEAFARVDQHGLAVDADGRVYVLDQGNFVVQVFDRRGQHLRSLGRKGGGPGELLYPARLYLTDNTLHIVDGGKRALVRFDTAGNVLPELRLPAALAPNSNPRPVAGGGLVASIDSTLSSNEPLRTGSPLLRRLVYFAPDNPGEWAAPRDLAALDWEQPPFQRVGSATCPITIQTPPVFYREPVWRAEPGRLFYNPVPEYVVDASSFTGTRASIRRELRVHSATRELAAAEIGPSNFEFQGKSCSATGQERADQATWFDRIPWIVDVRQAPSGEVLVLRRAPGEQPNRRIDVFDTRGEYAGTLPPDFPLPAAWRGTDEFVLLERDTDGVALVLVYRITRAQK